MSSGKTVLIEGGMDAESIYAVLWNVSSCFLARWRRIKGNQANPAVKETETAIHFMP
jgi:hypothetical protein